MTIKTVVTQTCNGCGISRALEARDNADNGGWREVKNNKHLCAECIDAAVKK